MEKKTLLKKRQALGRGLSALLGESEQQEQQQTENQQMSVGNVAEISLENIETNPFQPRQDFDPIALQELADSIALQGIIQPITLRKLNENAYQIIAGERRFQASKMAGLSQIPAYIRTANDQQMLEMALIENIQREDLNPIEISLSYQRLISECHLRQEDLADRMGKNRTTVTNYLRLLKLPPVIQSGLRDKKLTMGHARALINLENIEMQLAIYDQILKDDLSVRKVEEMVRTMLTSSQNTAKIPPKVLAQNPQIFQLQGNLSNKFGTKVQIKRGEDQKGEIRIPFLSDEDFNRILEILDI
ncbi:MAG: ParB/RepB/Spo0J family partition protein [Bacteroidetes bacterium]|nr:MAG: ParB/RepB/Spo0J family partition protein [Bacteroidota bacterium]